ncbi:MAG: DNA polymerase IV [Actinobacteria bacterium]|nr:DNA polymerase IV [Actinomycetota bacterium]
MPEDARHPDRTWGDRAILHVDLDAFFAAVEQLDHPEYRGRAVIVGGSPEGRGVVSTASYEARRYGIRSAMPAARAAKLAPQDAVWVRPRMGRYQELSKMVFEVFERATPHVEPVSIDEAFLDITPGKYGDDDPVATAFRIADEVAALGITCSAGLGTSRTVAKIASERQKPQGITIVYPGDERAFLAPLPIEVMSGIGPVSASRLKSMGVLTLADLAQLDPATSRELLGSSGSVLVERARGIDGRSIAGGPKRASISSEKTFASDIREPDSVRKAVDLLSTKVARRIRRRGVAATKVHLKVRFSDFTTRTMQQALSAPTNDERKIASVVMESVAKIWTPGVGIRLLGVGVSGLSEKGQQMDLFQSTTDDPLRPRESTSDQLLMSIDAVNKRFGEGSLRRGTTKVEDIAEDSSD